MAKNTRLEKKSRRRRKPERLTRNPLLRYERAARRRGFFWIAGVDEAGRGPLAGPVVASAVLLKEFRFCEKIIDSKQLSPNRRERAFEEIKDKAIVEVGIVGEKLIDRINILSATAKAMEKAICALASRISQKLDGRFSLVSGAPEDLICFLVDGRIKLSTPYAYQTIVGGDQLSLSVASASIVAKVVRDRIMIDFDRRFPQYGFARHKGYGTAEHLACLCRFGPSPIHRRSFRPLRQLPSATLPKSRASGNFVVDKES